MSSVKIVSFDLEGTLVTPDFSQAVWHGGIPSLFAAKNCISLEKAKEEVRKEYEDIDDQRPEWYDIKYWLHRFGLGDYRELLESLRDKVAYYPEVASVLSSLGTTYTLIVTTGTAVEFLPYLLSEIEGCFVRIFSAISDYGQLKTPSFYMRVCQEMGVLPEEMVHVGDSWQFDFISPKEAGINAFYIRRNGQPGRESITNLQQLGSRLAQLEKSPG